MAEQLVMRGTLEGHSGWCISPPCPRHPHCAADIRVRVTSLATSLENPNMLLSGSRDKTLIVWNLTRDDQNYGYPKRSLHGHSHIVSDCVRNPRYIGRKPELITPRSYPLTVLTLSPLLGTRLSASGNSLPAQPPAASSVTPTMSSPSPSLPITVRSSRDHEIVQSSYGTHSATANSPSPIRVTLNGSHASASAPILRTRSSLVPVGTSW